MTGPRVTADDLAGLRRAAEAATPGGWEVCAFDSGHSKFEMSVFVVTQELGDQICDMDGLARWNNERDAKDDGYADARFIAAANPATVLALLDVLAAAQTKLAAVRALHRRGQSRTDHRCATGHWEERRYVNHWIEDDCPTLAALAEGPAPETTPNGPRRADVRVESQPSEEAK